MNRRIDSVKYTFFISALFLTIAQAQIDSVESYSTLWTIDNIERIADTSTTVYGEPHVIETEIASAVAFDGLDDGLLVDDNPLNNAEEFTVEVLFKPDSSSLAANIEQRFVHIQESDERRILIELRLTDDNQWFLDTFIKDGTSSLALYAEEYPHPIGGWYHAALVYKDGKMRHYVNGLEELSGDVQYSKMTSGKTSLAVRQNLVSWYKGAISILKVTHEALAPDDFLQTLTSLEHETGEINYLDRKSFHLYQNFPNPFNPDTAIKFDVIRATHVDLSVFDTCGRKVTTLVDGMMSDGSYQVKWGKYHNSDFLLAGGVYYARLQAGYQQSTIKLLYLP